MALTTERALMPAVLRTMRLGASRLGYARVSPHFRIGPHRSPGSALRVHAASFTIQDQLNERPNTCSFTVDGERPLEGQELIASYGSLHGRRAFGGHVLRVTQAYLVNNPANVVWNVEGIDYTWRFNQRLVSQRYTNQSATTIARDLMARYAPTGYTGGSIAADLPTVDEISFTNTPLMDAFAQLASRIGGYAKVDYFRVVHLFLTDASVQNPRPLVATHASLDALTYERDLSQIATRVLVEGGGVTAIAAAIPGDTRIAVDDTSWYNAAGGRVVAGPQRLTYTGLVVGGAGSLVGPGVTPSAAPIAGASPGTGIDAGVHGYAYTWVTAAGETLASPIGSIVHGDLATPTSAPTLSGVHPTQSTTSYTPGETVLWTYCYSAAATFADLTACTAQSPTSAPWVVPVGPAGGSWAAIPNIAIPYNPPIDSRIKYVHIFEKRGAGPWRYATGASVVNWTWDTAYTTWSTSSTAPPTPNPSVRRTALSGVAVGPSSVTSRRVYRTQAGASQLKLLTTLGDNTTTTYADSLADSALGANVPTGDTSGLTQPTGQLQAGATSIIVAGTGPFGTTGFARLGNQVIRYSGTSGNQLTGIPASGDGALVSSVPYNTPITVAPQLTGIPTSGDGAITLRILPGDEVNLLVIEDDLAAQATLAALLGGGDAGIQETYIQDRRISESEARARAGAELADRSAVQTSIRYTSRDPQTQAGATVQVALDAPTSINGSFKIQDVQLSAFDAAGVVPPTFDATASSRRFTLEDLLRRARAQQRQTGG